MNYIYIHLYKKFINFYNINKFLNNIYIYTYYYYYLYFFYNFNGPGHITIIF